MPISAKKLVSFFSGKTIVISGGTGHLGSHVISKLVEYGADVHALVRSNSKLSIQSKIQLHEANIRNLQIDELANKIQSADIMYHIAATGISPHDTDIENLFQTNVNGTLGFLNLGIRLGIKKFIYVGSCFEYGPGKNLMESSLPQPNCVYGASKLAAWNLISVMAQNEGITPINLRPFTLYGPNERSDRIISHVIKNIIEQKPISLTKGRQSRDFVYIEDVVDAFVLAGFLPFHRAQIFNVGTGKSTTVQQIVKDICRLMNAKPKIQWGSISSRPDEKKFNSASTKKAKSKLHWSAKTKLSVGLQKTIDWHHGLKTRPI